MYKTNISINSYYGPIRYNGISANADSLYDTIDFESATLVTPDGPKDITNTEFAMSEALAWLREHIDQVEEDQEEMDNAQEELATGITDMNEEDSVHSAIKDALADLKGY